MDKLNYIRRKAKRLGIKGDIDVSNAKNKKYSIVLPEGKTINFGDSRYEDFIDHKDNERRKNYLARAKKIKNKSGKFTYKDKYSPNYYSVNLLW